MSDKKRPGRFTIQFNDHDPQHKTVIALLNKQGRNKAQFLTNAVLHYINCSEVPEFRRPVPDAEALERLVLEILARRGGGTEQERNLGEDMPTASPTKMSIRSDEEQWFGGKEGVASILNSLELFSNY